MNEGDPRDAADRNRSGADATGANDPVTGGGDIGRGPVAPAGAKELAEANAAGFDERRLWKTVRRQASRWGEAMLTQILTLYYCMVDPKTPVRSKTIIAGALAYTVLPTDLIPDILPAVGWSDDAALIAWAGVEVLNSIDEGHRRKAREQAARLLGRRPPSAT